MNAVTPPASTSAFELIASDTLSSLNIELQTYKHIKTGALHYHFAADAEENVFLAGLRTVPTDSTGVAHILEHTALCGSERFPVRDPFFMMLRRSLNTFMNAITSSDWTAYPFASANRKDFFNLLDVYLDAVFFSNLHPLDFAQEGHRLAFVDDDPKNDLEYRGVVYNEMKGAMSSVQSVLWHTMTEHVFSENTYHYNSGGEPADIPDLSYDDLQAFYQKHYHPSNAMLMTFGNIAVDELHAFFEEKALSKFEANDANITVGKEPRLSQPKAVAAPYAASSDSDTSHVTVSWLLGESTNIEDYLKANVLEGVLLDNSASPLRQMLETSSLGSAPSTMSGLEDTNREMMFVAGLEGCDKAQAEAVEQQILGCLTSVAENGVPQNQIDAVLHQLELHQREITGDGYPYGLQLIMQSLSAAVHRGNPVNVLDIDQALARLREASQHADFIPNLIKELLLDNTHRVRLCLYPDQTLAEQEAAAEKAKLADIKASLTEQQIADIVKLNQELAERQEQQDPEDSLPKVGLDDIPQGLPTIEANVQAGTTPVYQYAAGTNGLVYQQAVISLAGLTQQERELLPFYCRCLTEVGLGEHDYLVVQQRQAETVGGIYSYFGLQNDRNDSSQQLSYLTLDSKALERNLAEQTALLQDTLAKANFNAPQRVKELLQQYTAQKLQGIVGSGHSYAMQTASAHFSAVNQLEYETTGLAGIAKLKALSASCDDDNAVQALCDQLQALHNSIMKLPLQIINIGDQALLDQMSSIAWPANAGDFSQRFSLPQSNTPSAVAWEINSQVNYGSLAFKTVEPSHADAPALAVLGGFLRNGYLHTAVREKGGAYGGGASHDASNSVFRFYSYRDPRLEATFNDFSQSIDWMLNSKHSQQPLEEAILGVIGSLDKPGSPAGECKKAYAHQLYGRTHEQRLQFREGIINTQIDDLKRVTERYLTTTPSYAVLGGQSQLEQSAEFLRSLNFECFSL